MKNLSLYCIDINSQYCPCLLAETNHCVFCSQLKGEAQCNCNWQGICVFYERYWQKKNMASAKSPVRSEITTNITISEELAKDIFLFHFSVPIDLAEQLNKPGAFVFLRAAGDEHFCRFPVGIMKVSKNEIYVVVEKAGPKSARLFFNNNTEIIVRGPYYNGMFGQPWIDKIMNGKILLIAGGMGQPPALPAAIRLRQNNNKVTAILAPGKIEKIFIAEEFIKLGIESHPVLSMRKDGMPLFKELLKDKPDLIVSAGPDEQHYAAVNILQDLALDIPMAATNNSPMCCGEGMCGSCIKETNDNKKIRTCKVQTDFTYLIPY
jgi:NAD(P)H-flavin reductase